MNSSDTSRPNQELFPENFQESENDCGDYVEKPEIKDRRTLPFFQTENRVIDTYLEVIGVYAYAVYSVLCRIAGRKDSAFPGVLSIAETCGISERQAQRSLRRLEATQMIIISPRFSVGKKHRSNLYSLVDLRDYSKPYLRALIDTLEKGEDSESGDSQSPGVVTHSHHGGDSQSPPPKNTHRKKTQEEEDNITDSAALHRETKKDSPPETSSLKVNPKSEERLAPKPQVEREPSLPKEIPKPPSCAAPPSAAKGGDPLWKRILDLCDIDLDTYTGGILRFAKEMKVFKRLEATIEQVDQWEKWYEEYDWRGQKGQFPTIQVLRETWRHAFSPIKTRKEKRNGITSGRYLPPSEIISLVRR